MLGKVERTIVPYSHSRLQTHYRLLSSRNIVCSCRAIICRIPDQGHIPIILVSVGDCILHLESKQDMKAISSQHCRYAASIKDL